MNKHEHHESESFNILLRETIASEPLPPADPSLRAALLKRLDQPASPPVRPALSVEAAHRRRTFFQRAGIALVSTAALALVAVIWQRPDLQVVGWHEGRPAAVQADTSTAQKSSSSEASSLQAQPAREDGAVSDLDALRVEGIHDRRVADLPVLDRFGDTSRPAGSPAPNVTSGVSNAPASTAPASAAGGSSGPQSGTYSTRGNRYYFGPGAQAIGGSGEGKPGLSTADSLGGYGVGGGGAQPANPAVVQLQALPSEPQGVVESTTAPATATVTKTPRLLIEDEKGGPLAFESESKVGNGQGQPGRPDSNFYKESGGKSVAGKELKGIEDRLTVDQAEGLSRQLAMNEALLKQRAVDGERREKFSKVATLTDELNRAKRLSDREPQLEQQQLARLEKAIEEAREVEARFRVIPQPGGEQYARIVENQFLNPATAEHALSTFAIDVDTASYANVRRFLNGGQLPPPDAVRIEEFVNYFKYKYPQPKGDDPFSVNMEMADCPWHPGHKLLRVGVQGKEIHRAERPASNLVFLIDTSGSMTDENKLPLLKTSFKMLVGELNENDKVTIVTYAGNAGLRLPPTRGHEKETIIAAIDGMQSGGSTHGSAGIKLAYEIAAAQFIKDGTNKVILATDGDLNVGITDDAALVELISQKAETGVYLTVLGVGTGNLKDAKMERLADNGNGIYAYLDSVREAQKVLVEEMSGSLVTIAKDVKIQLEFNPAEVQSYRLLGYENRVMANKDFRNDAKDAGEIGAGHSVTAMYEVALVGAGNPMAKADDKPQEEPLKYQRPAVTESEALKYQKAPEAAKLNLTDAAKHGELLTLRLRYKKPEATKEDAAKELQFPLKDKGGNFNSASQDFQFASAVVAFGLTLRNSEFRGGANLSAVQEIATAVTGDDVGGHRAEFVDLVRRAKTLRGE